MMKDHKYDYVLKCPSCGEEYIDDGFRLGCDICKKKNNKVILEYIPVKNAGIDQNENGISRYKDFLPGRFFIKQTPRLTRTFKSKKFAKKYGFKNLYFTCTGTNNELDVNATTASFKELEAICVLHRLQSFGENKTIVLSSAGNTARAFAYYAAKNSYRVIIVVPLISRSFLWLPNEDGLYDKIKKYVRIVFMDQPAKYLHASMLAKNILNLLGDSVLSEGGYFNIARVSGLGSCALEFFDTTGFFPKHYVQAVGSGAGVLASFKNYSLLNPGRASDIIYHLVQNIPYDPLVNAINTGKQFAPLEHYRFLDTVCSPMLTSGDPALDYPGGLLEQQKKGIRLIGHSVSNNEIYHTHYEMESLENIQTLLPAAAAVAGLIKAKEKGIIDPKDIIQVNITGCGEEKSKNKSGFFYLNDSIGEAVPEQASFGGKNFEQWFTQFANNIVDFI